MYKLSTDISGKIEKVKIIFIYELKMFIIYFVYHEKDSQYLRNLWYVFVYIVIKLIDL